MSNDLFRKSSLEKISSPEQLNEYIKITYPGVWTMLIGCIIILAAAGVWFALGSIPDTVAAKGVIFPADGTMTVVAPAGGKINDMRVKTGDVVQLHDIIAVVPQSGILAEIEDMQGAEQPDEAAIKAKQRKYEDLSIIRSQVYGIVLSAKHLNEAVAEGEALASIARMEEGTNNYALVSYVDTDTAKRLQTGMEVQVSLSFAPREEYGYMYGYITQVGEYPVTNEDIASAVGSLGYISGIAGEGNLVEVRVDILLDAHDGEAQNMAKWSNAKGKDLSLTIAPTI